MTRTAGNTKTMTAAQYARLTRARAFKAERVLASAERGLILEEKQDGTFDGSPQEVARAAANRLIRGGKSKAFPETMDDPGYSLMDALRAHGIAASETGKGGSARKIWLKTKRSFENLHAASGNAQDLETIVRLMNEAAANAMKKSA